MVIRKWNENKKDYDDVTIPDEWKTPLICVNKEKEDNENNNRKEN